MKTVNFDIFKKLTKPLPNAPGISLRSVKCGQDPPFAEASILAQDYAPLREELASFRMSRHASIKSRVRGKTLAIRSEGEGALQLMMEFLCAINYNAEELMEFFDFYDKNFVQKSEAFSRVELKDVELDLEHARLGCSAQLAEDEDPEELYAGLMPALERCAMGVAKDIESGQDPHSNPGAEISDD